MSTTVEETQNQLADKNSKTQKMNKESSSSYAKRILEALGRPIPGKIKFYFKLILLSHILVAAQSVMVIISQWDDFAIRSKAIENLNLAFLSFFTIGELTFFPEKIIFLMKTTDGPIFKYKFPLSEKQNKIKNAAIKEESGMQRRFVLIITYYCIMGHIVPFLYSVGTMVFTNIPCCENAHYNYVYWLPFPLENIFIYSFILMLQIVCTVTMSLAYVCWFVLFISSLLHIGKEIDILCSFIKEIDSRLLSNSTSNILQTSSNDKDENIIETLNTEAELKLKLLTKEIVQHHLAILQAVKDVNKTGSHVMFMYNQFCCIELCLNLYLTLVVTDIKRYNYLTTFFIVMTLVGTIGNVGQKLSNKGEKLYKIINGCSWINKPNWFKKSVYIMIIHAAKPLQIKPGGIYVLNLENTMKIGQAAYSYFNLLRSFK